MHEARASQGAERQENKANRETDNPEIGNFCAVKRKAGMVAVSRAGLGTQHYHLAESGDLKRFSQYYNTRGQKLYQNGKPWGEWQNVAAEKTLFLYSGEQGLGVYTAAGECLRQLQRKPNDATVVGSDLFDAQGRRVYHSQSETFYTADGKMQSAVIQVGPPKGKENFDSRPEARLNNRVGPSDPFAGPYSPITSPSPSDRVFAQQSYDEDSIPSPSDLRSPQVVPTLETEFKSSTAHVITGEYTDRCGRKQYQLACNQKIWEGSGAPDTRVGSPSIRLTQEEIASGKKQGEYTIVENEHGVFRVKDGEVERQAVVNRENWRTGHQECRCVAVRGCFGRTRYKRQAVWVERSHAAVRLGWVKDQAVGLESNESDGYQSSGRNGDGNGRGDGNRSNQSRPPLGVPSSDSVPSAEKSIFPSNSGTAPRVGAPSTGATPPQPSEIPPVVQPSLPHSSPAPAETGAILPLDRQVAPTAVGGLPQLRQGVLPESAAPTATPIELEKRQSAANAAIPVIELPQVQSEKIGEGVIPVVQPLDAIKPPQPESQNGPGIATLPLTPDRPSITDSPNGSPDTIPIQPWTPPKLPEVPQDQIARKESRTPQLPEIPLESLQLPERPQLVRPQQLDAVMRLVARLEQVEAFNEIAYRAAEDFQSFGNRDALAYISNGLAASGSGYDWLLSQSNRDLATIDKQSPEYAWFTKAAEDIGSAHTGLLEVDGKIIRGEAIGAGDAAQMVDLIETNRQALISDLDRIFSGEVDLGTLLDWANSSDEHRRFYQDTIQRLEQYRNSGSWEQNQRPRQPLRRPIAESLELA